MPNKRNSFIPTVEFTTPRRSPRFLHQETTAEPPRQPKTSQRAEDFRCFTSKSTRKSVCCSNPSSSSAAIQISLSPQSHNGSKNKSSKKSSDPGSKSRNFNTAPSDLRRSSRLNNGAGGFPCPRRSFRLSRQKIRFLELRDSPRRGLKKSRKPDDTLVDSENVKPGPGKSAELSSRFQSLIRSQRPMNTKHCSSQPDQTVSRATYVEIIDSDSDFSVKEETDKVVSHKTQVEDNPIEKSSGKGEQVIKDVSMSHGQFTIKGREVQERHEDKSEALVKVKRKRDENSEATQNGWTKEQEVALRRAYFAAKPTPHFWKKVSKLVPGKSAQDCFERIHQDHLTPPQHQPRSRAKKLKSSPLEEVLLSASKLLKPIANEARKPSRSKSKSYLTQKSLRKLLQRNRKVDPDHEGDLFSVLEPNVDFPTNAFPPSDALSTPVKRDEKQGWLQSCNEKSSSRQGKPLSRFNSSCDSDIVSPPVLKQVKNRVLHEKYINQLRCREARRRAASARLEMSKLGIGVSKESNVQKGGGVKSAKIALVSEARDAIKKFQRSQANLTDSCNSDEDIDNYVEAESCDDEDESQ